MPGPEAGWHEPCKSRDLRTVLWEPEGAIPSGHPAPFLMAIGLFAVASGMEGT